MWTTSTKLVVASAVACTGLLMFAALSMADDGPMAPAFSPKDGAIVAIKAKKNGKYLEVSPADGRLRATASSAKGNRHALFRVMILTKPMVDLLNDAMHTANSAAWSKRRHWTGTPPANGSTVQTNETGCPCSNYANDHGFGAYCYSWEYESQVPWCVCFYAEPVPFPSFSLGSSFSPEYISLPLSFAQVLRARRLHVAADARLVWAQVRRLPAHLPRRHAAVSG